MDRLLRGKCLVRKHTINSGEPVVILSGVFFPQNFSVEDIKPNDEMWVCDIIVSEGGVRFTDPYEIDGGSPEDFIAGIMQSPNDWKTRETL